jgi:hypothetical protein
MTYSLLTLLLLAATATDKPEAVLKSAIEDFEFGEHAQAAEKLRRVTEPPQLKSREDLIVARQYLGACYHLLDDKEKAKAQFSMLLALDPKHKLDPEVFSPALVEFFEEVRTETGLALQKSDEPRRGGSEADAAKKPDASGGASAAAELKPGRANPPLPLAFVPFGIGQFNNRQPVRGALFAAAEVGLFATAITTYLMFNGLKVPDDQRPASCNMDAACFRNQDDADKASTLQTIYLVTFWTGLVVTALGIVEALVSYPGDPPLESAALAPVSPGRAVLIDPRLRPDSAGGRVSIELRF